MRRRTVIKGITATVTATWVLPDVRAQVSPRPLVPVWMGEDMARRLIELIGRHEAPEDREAMIRVIERALSGANQPATPIPPNDPT